MSNYIVTGAQLTAVADAIRAKSGESGSIVFPTGFVSEINDITTGDEIDHSELPDYVRTEARAVAARVSPHLTNDSIVFICGSDSHQSSTAHVADGNLHGGESMKALAYMLPLDFAAYLGDYTAGSSTTTIEEGISHIESINADIDEAFRGLPQFRTVGNHDPLGYSYANNGNTALSQAQLYSLIGKYNAESGATMGSTVSGYCYRDFPAKQVRVICMNTADETPTSTGGTEIVSAAQKTWFADTLISTPEGYGIIILAHHPLDWGNIMFCSHILRAYVEEQSNFVIGNTTYDFTGKNKSAWQIQIHGHVHTFTVDDMHYNNNGTGVAYDVKRIAAPNMCFVRNNEYGTTPVYYGIVFGTATTYNKTADSGDDTAWCVFVVNPSEQKVYAINYGAGYDREVYWGASSVAVTGITLSASTGTMYVNDTFTLTATIAPNDATNKAVIWTSSNDAIATVNNGVITAHAVGSATITATTQDGGFTATYALTVTAVPQGNLINVIGYTDGKRLSTGDGSYKELAGGVVIEYIDLATYRQADNTVVIRAKGATFQSWQSGSQYNNNAYVFYKANKTFTSAQYLTEGSSTHGNITVTKSFSNGEMTLTISGLSASYANGSYHYLRFCGLGSGANVDLRINENFS